RTPMNAILGYSQILRRDQEATPKQRQAVETIERSGQHLLSMINDILDLAKIEAGKMEVHAVDFDLRSLVEDVAAMCAMRCEQKGLEFSVEWRGARVEDTVGRAPLAETHRRRSRGFNLKIIYTHHGDNHLINY
ncbi:MAG: hypothetical protein HGA42_08080, partial [Nostocales cyanobacterium W4_Combined_metabat2_030]|nr:hypothetical protein [Nostocales cyanobacterium W4_Combined_metabat2_030]